ncbi:MAG TPA: diguanylate cyclase [Candidatus Obscuribacterales bacterium]
MNASVLIVGDAAFSQRLCEQVRAFSAMTVWQVEDAEAALRLLASDVPDILLLQATQQSNWELCHSLKQQKHLLWCYFILLDERECPNAPPAPEVLLRHMGLTTTALETGADAYCWLPEIPPAEAAIALEHLNRLIEAHVRTAMRRIQAHRELSQTNDLLSAIALIDPLTQLGNRRAFDWEMPRQIQAARAQNHPLSLLVLDIDFFKQVNDGYGHLVGDQVLRMFADRLRHHMRFYETPFRYGGEEFVVILQNTSFEEAEKVAERLRRLIGDTPFVVSQHLDLPLTISIGAATLDPSDDPQGEDLIGRADGNLLRAKNTGRNRVISS